MSFSGKKIMQGLYYPQSTIIQTGKVNKVNVASKQKLRAE